MTSPVQVAALPVGHKDAENLEKDSEFDEEDDDAIYGRSKAYILQVPGR